MPTNRTGFIDSYHSSRLAHITGTSYPTTPAGNFLAVYIGSIPGSSGSGGTEATGTRPSVTLGSPQTDSNGRYYITNSSSVTTTLTNTSAGEIVGYGICAASTGGTPIYVDRLPSPFQVAAGASVTIPAGAIKIYAENNF